MQTLLSYGFEQIEWQVALLSFLLTFLLTTCIALLYEKTYQGLSYSRGLVQSMILGSIVTCLLMISIGDNIARGIGIVGSLAIIRFRTNLREPRDLVFIFSSLGVGVRRRFSALSQRPCTCRPSARGGSTTASCAFRFRPNRTRPTK
jgi:hypothetical protein